MTMLDQLVEQIRQANYITVLSGAGISTASGIPDFRSPNGIYSKVNNVEYLLSEGYYATHPKDFWTNFKDIFLMERMQQYEPNPAHTMLAELEALGKKVTIITQNVDGLHRKAGSQHILEAHGSIDHAHCPKCKRSYKLPYVMAEKIPRCEHDNFILKPDVVLFGGMVRHLPEAYEASEQCDLFLTLGSSLQVYPVKELPFYANRASQPKLAIINYEATDLDYLFDIVIHDDLVASFNYIKQYL